MISKKPYIKPEVTRVALDQSIVLMQVSNPDPRSAPGSPPAKGTVLDSKGLDEPAFQSPFGDKPFG